MKDRRPIDGNTVNNPSRHTRRNQSTKLHWLLIANCLPTAVNFPNKFPER